MSASLNINDIDAAYNSIRGTIAVDSMYYVVVGIMAVTLVSRVINVYREVQQNDDGVPTIRDYFSMLYQYMFLILVVALFPHLLQILEKIFGEVMTKLQEGFGTERYDMADIFRKPIEEEWNKQVENDYMGVLVNPIGKGLDYILTYVIGAICAPIYLHASTLFIAGRYMFLLMLELISPVAIACFYNENTRTYFYQWLKGMLICYLLVPFFILASQFSDEIVTRFILTTPWAISLQILYSLILKFSLLAIVRNKISNLF